MRPALIDICFNFAHSAFREDGEAVLQRAGEAGVTRMLVTGSTLEDSATCIELAETYPDRLYATVGTHPHYASQWHAGAPARVRELAGHPKVKAIGEAGLDFNRNYSTEAEQVRAFTAQLELAVALQLPVFMHEREARPRFVEILDRYLADLPRAVVHCFTGSEADLDAYLERDLYIGVTGWICDERRGRHLHDILAKIPADRLLLETDAPYLLPRSLRPKPASRRNEPAYLPEVLRVVAAALGAPEAEVAATTTANACRFYGL